MSSVLSVRAFEADNLVNGIYRLYVRENQVVITDETNEWIIGQADIDEIEDEIEALEQSINELANETETALDGKTDIGHTHSINDITNLQSSLDGKAASSHTHSINDITNLQSSLDGKASLNHDHEFDDIYYSYEEEEEIEEDGETITRTITKTKGLEQVLNERENTLRGLINGKAPSSHTHSINDITNLQTELDSIKADIEVLDGNGDKQGILDILFGGIDVAEAIGEGALFSQIQTLQGEMAAVQAQVAGLAGTYAVGNTNDAIMEVADELSDFSEVGAEGRNVMDSISDWFSSFRQRIAGQTNRYNQLVNDYTSPALESVSNETALYVI